MTDERTLAMLADLVNQPAETAWLEFKENQNDPKMIGRLISAIANAARLADKETGYVLWGVKDGDRSLVGSALQPAAQKVENEPLEFWLANRLQPDPGAKFQTVDFDGVKLVLLTIPAATQTPVEFERAAYIRIGSATPRLSDYPERLRALWTKLQPRAWEMGIAGQFMSTEDVLATIDYGAYFILTGQPTPDGHAGILARMAQDGLVQSDFGGNWNVTNLGAILFARHLPDFDGALARKAVRIVGYSGTSRADMVVTRHESDRGYAVGFQSLMEFLEAALPQNEHVALAFREQVQLYPSIALRELIANALIHQDMTIRGAGPTIELFSDRIEITNPGVPLVSPDRFLDSPPRSRNEALAALMRRMRLCEEQGTGIDKVISAVELHQLPAPDFRSAGEAVQIALFAPRSFSDMTSDERVRACYQHAGLCYVSGMRMRNASLCRRLGIDERNAAQASNVIKRTLETGLIRIADTDHPRAGYVPFWA